LRRLSSDRHPEQIVDQLAALASTGLDGIVLSWLARRDAQRIAEVMPLIEPAGFAKALPTKIQ
jgi:hypothetical protein